MEIEEDLAQPNNEELPLDKSIRLLKSGDLKASRTALGIPEDAISDEDFILRMRSLDRGMELFKEVKFDEAAEHLRLAFEVIMLSSDVHSKHIIAIAASFAQGITRLWSGDAYGAWPYLNASADVIERLSFFVPGFDKYTLSIKATCSLALVRVAMSVGDLEKVRTYYAYANQSYEELFQKLDKDNEDDIPGFAEIYSSKVEYAVIFVLISLSVLDFDEAERHLQSAASDYSRLMDLPALLKEPIRSAVKVITTVYSILETCCKIGRKVIVNHSPLDLDDAREIDEGSKLLLEAKTLVHGRGGRVIGYHYQITQLLRFCEQLQKIDAVTKKALGRKPRLFISHATVDRDFVEDELIGLLHALGFDTWFAEEDIKTAEQWERAIRGSLKSSEWFVLVMSQSSASSEWVKAEVAWAIKERQGRIVPILIEDCDVTDIHLWLPQIQYIDYCNKPNKARERLIKLLIDTQYRSPM